MFVLISGSQLEEDPYGLERFTLASRIGLDSTSTGTIDQDLAVQKIGGGTNLTPVGRVEDDAGIVLKINTIGYTNTVLDFDWRTFQAETTDRFRVGYYVGAIPGFTSSDYFDAVSTIYAWSAWTPLLGASSSNTFTHQTYALPNNQSTVWSRSGSTTARATTARSTTWS